MIKSYGEVIEAERRQRLARGGAQLGFDDGQACPRHVNVALVELAEAPARGAVCAPDGLNLVALEKLREPLAVLCDDARERHRQIVAQRQIGFAGLLVLAALEDFEDELVALLAVLP